MTSIIVTHESNEVDEFDFDDGQENISIGRRSSNDVCIPDLSVSGNHALITFESGSFWLEDLNSTNGTYVNGQVVQRQPIGEDDEIIIGKIRLTFLGPATGQHPVIFNESVERTATVSSDFGDGHVEPLDVIDPLAMNEASEGIEAHSEAAGQTGEEAAITESDTHAQDSLEADSAHTTTSSQTSTLTASPSASPSSSSTASPSTDTQTQVLELDSAPSSTSRGAVIEIKNGAKSGQILPIDKPVTTLGRPGIQIAAIMRKPDGYFLMHIESDDSVERPTLNRDAIGDEPVLLHSGDELNVAGIDVEFMLS